MTHKVPQDFPHRCRLSDYGVGLFPDIPTKSAVKKAIKRSLLLVNEAKASTGYFVSPGDIISFRPEKINFVPYPIDLEVLYEDRELAVVKKPAGLAIYNYQHRNLLHALPTNLKPGLSKDPLPYPTPVHRLDYATEGLLIIAKSHQALRQLQNMFVNHEITKNYFTIANGKLPAEGKICLPIAAKKTKTLFTTLKYFEHPTAGILSFLRIELVTGKRHQIRKHLAFIGHPIIGDKLYNDSNTAGFRGLHLIACELKFLHPINGKEMHITLPLPKKFRKLSCKTL